MTLAQLLAALDGKAARLSSPDGERLRFESPRPLPPALLDGLRAHKAELLAWLAQGRPPVPLPGTCGACLHWDEADFGACALGWAAHVTPGWPAGNTSRPVTAFRHVCDAHGGKGYQAREVAP